jgi:hypothetical protein
MTRSSAPRSKVAPRPRAVAFVGSAPARTRALSSCALALGLLASLAACDDDDGGSGYKKSCEQTCERAHDCVSSVDAETCTEDCIEDLAEIGDHLSTDYVKGIDACFADLSCDQLVGALTSNQCQDEASARLAPSQAAIDLCENVADSLQECTGLSTGTAGCIDSVKIFNDGTLRSALTCAEQDCTKRFGCLQDQLGISLTP